MGGNGEGGVLREEEGELMNCGKEQGKGETFKEDMRRGSRQFQQW